MTVEERHAAARRFEPGAVLAEHGQHELRVVPACSTVIEEFQHDWEPAVSGETRDFIFRNTFKDIETIVAPLGARRHSVRVRVLRRRPPLQPRPLPRARARPAAAVRADDLRDPRRHRPRRREPAAHEGGRPTGCSATTTTGRSSAPAATRPTSSRSARSWAATCASASRTRSTSPRAGSPSRTPSRSRRSRGSSASSRSRSRRPTRRAQMLALKGASDTAIGG